MLDDKMPEFLKQARDSYLNLEYSSSGRSSFPFKEGFNLCFELLCKPENLKRILEVATLLREIKSGVKNLSNWSDDNDIKASGFHIPMSSIELALKTFQENCEVQNDRL